MKTYEVKAGTEIETIEAEDAVAAIKKFSEGKGPDSDLGFLRGGLVFDAETRGEKWAQMNSDGGKISAQVVE